MSARSIVLLLLVALGAAALTALAVAGRLVPGEASFARSLQDAPLGAGIEGLADVLASKFIEYPMVAATALAALRSRRYALAATVVLVLACIALNPAIKELVQRGRPTEADVVIREHAGGYGFPSGHVQSATLAYGYAAVGAGRLVMPAAAAAIIAASAIAVAAIGFDRVYNGAHWPSDVAGGALIGTLLVVAAVRLPEELRRFIAPGPAGSTHSSGDPG